MTKLEFKNTYGKEFTKKANRAIKRLEGKAYLPYKFTIKTKNKRYRRDFWAWGGYVE